MGLHKKHNKMIQNWVEIVSVSCPLHQPADVNKRRTKSAITGGGG